MPKITIDVKPDDPKEDVDAIDGEDVKKGLECPRCDGKAVESGKKIACMDCGRSWPKSEYDAMMAMDKEADDEEADAAEGDSE